MNELITLESSRSKSITATENITQLNRKCSKDIPGLALCLVAGVGVVRIATLAQPHSRSVVVSRIAVMQPDRTSVEGKHGSNAADDTTSTEYAD